MFLRFILALDNFEIINSNHLIEYFPSIELNILRFLSSKIQPIQNYLHVHFLILSHLQSNMSFIVSKNHIEPLYIINNNPFKKYNITSTITKYKDFVTHDFVDLNDLLEPLEGTLAYHRKNWEYMKIYSTLKKTNKLKPGCKGLVFGCGKEKMISLFANFGCSILATDAPNADHWILTDQYANEKNDLFYPELISKDVFDKNVRFTHADMNNIDKYISNEKFDFIWSVCCFEHLGSLQKGIDFLIHSSKLLKPDGIAVHTTEFTFLNDPEMNFEYHDVCFYRADDILNAKKQLETNEFNIAPLDLERGKNYHDEIYARGKLPPGWIIPDFEPYDKMIYPYHGSIMVGDIPATCFCIAICHQGANI